MEGKTIFIVIGVLMIVLWTCREALKGLRSGIVEKTVKGSQTPMIISRAKEPSTYWSYIIVYFGMAIGALFTGIWLLFIK
ncbi:DUF2542 family protein [uncultured Citrobacter sp.]|uniref:DUF2542 family protein n=1 Tax=uncultured Citrobacter sp. TaxID=200446 RepID=UPI00266D58B1|nr:DUF2542 family protein [uncultured Citrobacter sp.]